MPTLSDYIRTPLASSVVGSRLGPRVNAPANPDCCCIACRTLQCLERTRFFSGQLLTQADLNNEQSYWLAKNRLHNRYLHGWGVACGMQVVCSECTGWVTVKTGYAIDPCGNDVIVCTDQPFNVIKAIEDCCAPTKQPAPNCSPLRYTPSPACKDLIQKWCITIEYKEQESRLITPLVNTPSNSASCGCGCGDKAVGNGHGNGSSAKNAGLACSAKTTQTLPAAVPPAGCEPTRIVEGFQLGVTPAPDETDATTPAPGSLLYQLQQCAKGIVLLIQQAPNLTGITNAQIAYQLTCKFLQAVNQYFAKSSSVTHCTILDDLSGIAIPAPQQGTDVSVYLGIVAQIVQELVHVLLDCVCFALIPACQPDPCDDRLILACVTVQDGRILDICHFSGRKQLVTIPSLQYWLGPLGLDNFSTWLEKVLQLFCCSDFREPRGASFLSGTQAYYQENLMSAGVGTPAALNRIATHYVAQTLGASTLNSISPGMRAVDLRTMVGQPVETVQQALKRQGFTNVTTVSVAEDPAWTPDAIASAGDFAASAVSVGQPLKMYQSGNAVVGFDVVDPTTAKLQDLQNQIDQLKAGGAAVGNTRASETPKKK